MKAIETTYKGYRFRSRLEARWAVFFDALGLQWEYEPEGFVTSAGWYLPDFRVRRTHRAGVDWVEVKPSGSSVDTTLMIAFCEGLAPGHPSIAYEGDRLNPIGGFTRQLSECGVHVVCGDPLDVVSAKYLCLSVYAQQGECTHAWRLRAATAARAARFEHGEAPR